MRYFQDYYAMHRANKFESHSMLRYLPEIGAMLSRFPTKSVLDYGCGNGKQYSRPDVAAMFSGIQVFKYDPPAGLLSFPRCGVDGVVCTDVMEHIPEEEAESAIVEMVAAARAWMLIAVCCRPANKALPVSGENAHVNLIPLSEWVRLFDKFRVRYHPNLFVRVIEAP